MLSWEEGFCRIVADRGRFVIRYGHRDTGRSATYEPGHPGYTSTDLVADAAGVLDAYGLTGGARGRRLPGWGFAQLLALDFADRVLVLAPDRVVGRSAPGGRDKPRGALKHDPGGPGVGRERLPYGCPCCGRDLVAGIGH
jgi:hypothetical protein